MGFENLRACSPRTEIVFVSDDRKDSLPGAPMTTVASHRVRTQVPFLLYYGDGPVYALIQNESADKGEVNSFQSADRALVEMLVFQLQSDLGIALSD